MVRNFLRKDTLNGTKILNISIKEITDEDIKIYEKTGNVSVFFKKEKYSMKKLTDKECEKLKQELDIILAHRKGEKVFVNGKNSKHFFENERKEKRLSKTIHSTVGERVKKHIGNENGWIRNLKRGEIKFDKPVVLFLGGNNTLNDKKANGNLSPFVKAMGRVGVTDNDIQIVSAYYPWLESVPIDDEKFTPMEKSMYYLKTRREDVDERYKNPTYVKDIYNAVIKPVLFKNARGKKQNPAEIAKKLRNLTIVSHCFGCVTAILLLKNISEDMQNIGFNEDEINQCVSEIVNISMSPRRGFFNKDSKALTIGFMAADDQMRTTGINIDNIREALYSEDVEESAMGIGLNVEMDGKEFLYMCGDTYDYKFGRSIMTDSNFGHLIDDYTDEDLVTEYWGEETPQISFIEELEIPKNKNGKNFCRLVCRSIQNAVSLSAMGQKRTIEGVVSNDTPIIFKQGSKKDNPNTVGVRFDGNNTEFEKNYEKQIEKIKKLKALREAARKLLAMGLSEKMKTSKPVDIQNKER